jgi:hypothetical protein
MLELVYPAIFLGIPLHAKAYLSRYILEAFLHELKLIYPVIFSKSQ